MDRVKKAASSARDGLKSGGDRPIHRDTWKSDVKNLASGKKKDPYSYARDHTSAPLSSLKDPDSFGAPPRHKDKDNYPSPERRTAGSSSSSSANPALPSRAAQRPEPTGGLGSPVPTPRTRQPQHEVEEEEEAAKPPPEPYRKDTTGLRTDQFQKPPTYRGNAAETNQQAAPSPPARNRAAPAPSAPPRNNAAPTPSLPPRQAQQAPRQAPAPSLPPRMTDHPDEHTPPPPPPYTEATRSSAQDAASINQGAANRLAQAGVSVPGFDIGNNDHNAPSSPSTTQGHPSQLSELQQRFARMNAGSSNGSTSRPNSAGGGGGPGSANSPTSASFDAVAAAAHKKAPPPRPPPKKASLVADAGAGAGAGHDVGEGVGAPPPLPLSSKPRPS